MDIDWLLQQASEALALPPPDFAARRHALHALLCRIANAYDQNRAPDAAERLERMLRDLAGALDRAEARAEAPPPSFRTRARIARRAAHRAIPRDDVRVIDFAGDLASSALGRALRATATGMLVTRVDRLVESAERILSLPVLATKPSPEKRDLFRQFELQVFSLQRIRNALAVACLDAEKIRRDARPLAFFLTGSLDAAVIVVQRLDRRLPVFEAWRLEDSSDADDRDPPSGRRAR